VIGVASVRPFKLTCSRREKQLDSDRPSQATALKTLQTKVAVLNGRGDILLTKA